MLLKNLLIAAGAAGIACVADAQVTDADRNFQRLDIPYFLTSRFGLAASGTAFTDQNFWQVAPSLRFPARAAADGASLIYTNQPYARATKADNLGSLALTTSYLRLMPSGGTNADLFSETATYQLTSDDMYAVTPGASYSIVNNGLKLFVPSVSARKQIPNTNVFLQPTASYDDITGNGMTSTGWVPDIMGIYAEKGKNLQSFADWTVATRVKGPGTVQIGGKYALTADKLTAIKAAVTLGAGSRPMFVGQLVVKI